MRSNREIVLAAVRRQGKVVAGKCTSYKYKSHVKHAALQNGIEECSENAPDILNLERKNRLGCLGSEHSFCCCHMNK